MFKEIEADMKLINEILTRVKDDVHFFGAFEAITRINIFLNKVSEEFLADLYKLFPDEDISELREKWGERL